MLTLIEIAHAVADEVGFKRPASVVGSRDRFARRILRLANRAGRSFNMNHIWSEMVTQATLTLVPATQTYTLPDDFLSFLPETQWDRSNARSLHGPISSIQWQDAKGIGVIPAVHRSFRLNGKVMEFLEEVTSADTLAYEYKSTDWAENAIGTGQSLFLADTDVPRLDDELLTQEIAWRFKKSKGLEWQQDAQDTMDYLSSLKGQDGGSKVINMGTGATPFPVNIPERDFG